MTKYNLTQKRKFHDDRNMDQAKIDLDLFNKYIYHKSMDIINDIKMSNSKHSELILSVIRTILNDQINEKRNNNIE